MPTANEPQRSSPTLESASPAVESDVPDPSAAQAGIAEPNAPGESGSWETALESDIASLSDPPAPKEPKPTPQTAKPAHQSLPTNPKPPAPKKDPEQANPAQRTPQQGRKANLDPDELLTVEGAEDAELPPGTLEALQKLDARDLRVQAAKVAKLARSQAAKLKGVEAELTKLRNTPKDDPEKAALLAERTQLQQRLDEKEQLLRYANYSQSEEYVTKFRKPFEQTLSDAYQTVKEFQVEGSDGQQRSATEKDFDELLQLHSTNRSLAQQRAQELFGAGAVEVMDYVRKIRDIQRSAQRATEEYKTRGAEVDKKKLTEQAQLRETQQKLWTQANESIPKRWPELFGKIDGDDAANALLLKGYAEVDKAFDPSSPVEERIGRQAANRHRAAAWSREVYLRKKLQKENEALKAKLKEFEESAPAGGAQDGSGSHATDPDDDPMQAIDRIAQAT